MKNIFNIALALLLTPVHAYSSLPACSNDSYDPDGDGYGWENNATCVIASGPQPSACIDNDGDGWGWDGVESCRVDAPEPENQTGIASELVGAWQCYVGIMRPQDSSWLINNQNNQIEGAPAWVGGCAQWESVRRYPLEFSQCDVDWNATFTAYSHTEGQLETHLLRLVLNDNLTGTVQRGVIRNYSTGLSRYLDPKNITWEVNGFELSIDNIPVHRLAFERYNGTDYFSYYSNDENRITCRAE